MNARLFSTCLLASFTFATLTTIPAMADPQHWFFDRYSQYERDFYDRDIMDDMDDEDFFDEDVVYIPPRQRLRQIRRERLRRWLRRNGRNYINARRNKRRTLDEVRQDERYGYRRTSIAPRRTSKPRRKPFRLAYVPIPRPKPSHMISSPVTPSLPVEKTALAPLVPKIPMEKAESKPVLAKRNIAEKDTPSPEKPVRISIASNKPQKPETKTEIPRPSSQISCARGRSIIADFGFSDITQKNCSGKTYDFAAKRDGDTYFIKLSSLSGELIDVNKQK